ncbi:MAG: PKD domain-containing protein [Oceanobacter sp.]
MSLSFPLSAKHCAVVLIAAGLLVACGGGSGGGSSASNNPPDPDVVVPTNPITKAWFRDQNGAVGKVSGRVSIETPGSADDVDTVRLYWADQQGQTIGSHWLSTDKQGAFDIVIADAEIPDGASALLLFPANEAGQAEQGTLVRFHDFTGNAELSGPGGNYDESWQYGDDRPAIPVHRTSLDTLATCVFDNGLVSVVDMANERDEAWHAASDGRANQADDAAFPPYQFECGQNPVNTHRKVSDDFGVWTYSTINDAMFYGTLVYDTYVKYLGEPPLEDKIRLRVHYAGRSRDYAYWDGAYANFSDAYPHQYSMAPLDAIAHEVGHGVLNRISNVNAFEYPVSQDVRTVHEAFADVSGVMAKYALTGNSDQWIHGEEARGPWVRHLDRIQTEPDAIPSLLDYDDAGDNYYLRIGMMTYPFYLLSQQWGLEATYGVYVEAARHCWQAQMSLTDAAQCIKTQAGAQGHSEQAVVEAFKTVKIALFDAGLLSHFTAQANQLQVVFADNSQNVGGSNAHAVVQWQWDFGDGHFSTVANPVHIYAEAGNYSVTLTVTDQSGGADSFTRAVLVTQAVD